MKRSIIMPFLVVLMVVFFGFMGVAAYADNSPSPSEVFPEDEVERLWQNAAALPVVSDPGVPEVGLQRVSSYPTRKGVILVTKDKYAKLIPTGHAAIIYSSSQVVESLQNGVTVGNNNWNKSHGTTYALNVKSTGNAQDITAANWCYGKTGLPYNYNYLDRENRSAFYCSQLVWMAYRDLYGIDLDTGDFGVAVHPVELINSSRTETIYYHAK